MIITPLVDFFLPRLCFSCNKKLLPIEDSVCSVCLIKYKVAGKEMKNAEYLKKFGGKKIISAFESMYVFEKGKEFQQLIHSLKYQKKFKAGIFLGRVMGEFYKDKISDWNIDVIIPIPLHRLKKLNRGYNQSYYIASGLSRVTLLPVLNKVVIRQKNTSSQTNMNLKEREENISNAFKVKHSRMIESKNILLVDDVITTGSTINECGKVLKEAGAAKIYAMSSAIADLERKDELLANDEIIN